MDKLRILVTGGTGFVGRHLVRALAMRPEQIDIVVGVHRNPLPADQDVRSVPFDITDANQVRTTLAAEQPSHIFHLAGIAQTANSDLRQTWAVNFDGVLNLATAIIDVAPTSRLLCCTSAEIYGDSCRYGQPIDESALLDPIVPYGASKAASDILIGQMAKQGLKAIRLRPFNHIGPGQSERFVVPAFASQLARIERGEQDPVMHVGNLTVRRDFLDVRDVVDAYIRAILRFDALPPGCAINVASGKAIEIEAILQMLLSFCKVKVDIVVDRERLRASESPVTVGDASRARALLDWMPRVDLLETLRSILEWHRVH
jgi:GDP-4-dehydro-6-deoxy-D-mannose reductase